MFGCLVLSCVCCVGFIGFVLNEAVAVLGGALSVVDPVCVSLLVHKKKIPNDLGL